jgi:hypothetical protein
MWKCKDNWMCYHVSEARADIPTGSRPELRLYICVAHTMATYMHMGHGELPHLLLPAGKTLRLSKRLGLLYASKLSQLYRLDGFSRYWLYWMSKPGIVQFPCWHSRAISTTSNTVSVIHVPQEFQHIFLDSRVLRNLCGK